MFLFLIWVRIQILFVNFNLISSCSLHGSRTSLGHESFLLMVEDSKALPPGLKVISVRRGVQPHELHCPEHLIRWVIRKRLQETCSWFSVLNDYIYRITQRPMVIKRYRDHIVTNMLHVSMQEQWSSNVVDWASVFIEVLISVQEQDGVDSVDYSREVSQTSENQTNEELNLHYLNKQIKILLSSPYISLILRKSPKQNQLQFLGNQTVTRIVINLVKLHID